MYANFLVFAFLGVNFVLASPIQSIDIKNDTVRDLQTDADDIPETQKSIWEKSLGAAKNISEEKCQELMVKREMVTSSLFSIYKKRVFELTQIINELIMRIQVNPQEMISKQDIISSEDTKLMNKIFEQLSSLEKTIWTANEANELDFMQGGCVAHCGPSSPMGCTASCQCM